jgi:hypothetical protein
MALEIRESKRPVSEIEIERIERRWGFIFPEEYKSFLLKHNGGFPPILNMFKFEDGDYGDSLVDWFLAIYDGKHDNFEHYYEVYKVKEQRLLENLVAIAHDPGGNLICLSVVGEDRGAVYFWDHEKEEDVATSRNVRLIAPSFNEFLEKLEPNEFA